MATTALSGVAFGAALIAAGVYQPGIIASQLKLQDWHMLQTFLAATASSSIIVLVLDKLDFYHPKPRSASGMGVFGPYDGNILGGALQGLGMALSGACPGTVVSQAVTGIPSGLYALAGSVLGGIAYAGFISDLITRHAAAASAPARDTTAPPPKLTLHDHLGISKAPFFAAFEALCWGAVLAAPENIRNVPLAPALGGAIIGLAQLFSVLSRKTMVGVSTSYDEAGKYFWWLVRGDAIRGVPPPSANNILFALGIAAGSLGLVTLRPEFAPPARTLSVSPLLAIAGGFLLAVGSRISGGCTSGHGVSGMSMFSTSSFVTMTVMFGVGALTGPLYL